MFILKTEKGKAGKENRIKRTVIRVEQSGYVEEEMLKVSYGLWQKGIAAVI